MNYSEKFGEMAEFDTHGDPEREILLDGATLYANSIANGAEPYSLALLGPSGIGKTHLAHALYRWAKRMSADKPDHNGIMHPQRITYHSVDRACHRFLDGEYDLLTRMEDDYFLVLDDIGTERDPNGTFRGKIQHLIDRRLGRAWTVLTSNMEFDDLIKYDARLASRLIRDGGKVVVSKATDYCLERLRNDR